jgi:shikimate kinase
VKRGSETAAQNVTSKRPPLVELVGPAGAGKSTVLEALLTRNETIVGPPRLRKTEYLLARNLAAVIGTLLRHRIFRPRVSIEQVRMMVYLQVLPRILDRAGSAEAIVFDQGPVFFLTRPSLMDERLATWRERVLDAWAPLLDVVVWLDAPDRLLIERINSRAKWHRLKGRQDQTALGVLLESRAVYHSALSGLEARGRGPTILRFDTSRVSAQDIAEDVLTVLGGCPPSARAGGAAESALRRGPNRRRSGGDRERR